MNGHFDGWCLKKNPSKLSVFTFCQKTEKNGSFDRSVWPFSGDGHFDESVICKSLSMGYLFEDIDWKFFFEVGGKEKVDKICLV